MDMTEFKGLVEAQNKAFEEFKNANDARLKEIEKKGAADPLLVEKVEKANADITRLSKEITDVAKRANRPAEPKAGELTDEQREHKKAFDRWARRGDNESELKAIERKTMAVSSDPDGGVFATEEIEAGVTRLLGETVAMVNLATVKTIGTASYKKRVRTSGTGHQWVGEGETTTENTTPRYSELEFVPGTISTEPQVSQEALDDLSISVESEIMDAAQQEFAEGVGAAFIDGNGVKKPRGLLSYTVVADASYAWGKIGYKPSGAAGGFASSNPTDNLIDLVHALKRGYRGNARWLMNDLTLAQIRKFKDGQNNYLWQPSAQAGIPGTYLGYGVEIDDNMPDYNTANDYPIAFGDFARAYLIVRRRGLSVLRDPFTAKPYTKFFMTLRVGGGIQNFEAVKLLKVATA